MKANRPSPNWMSLALYAAAAADLVGGALLVFLPGTVMGWAGLEGAGAGVALQGLGLLLMIQGLGLSLAGRRPLDLWPIALVGLLAKVVVPVGFAVAASGGRLAWDVWPLVLAIGPVWWLPLAAILRGVNRERISALAPPVLPLDMALSLYRDADGVDLLEASRTQPQFLVFLRHFGCTFCREALDDLGSINERLTEIGARLVLVHMSEEQEACDTFGRYGVADVTAVSDPDRVLYRAFSLRRGRPAQLMGWTVWKRGFEAGVKGGHGIGWLRGDAAQMPGAFVVSRGRVVAQFIHESAADRPDYVELAADGVDEAELQGELELDGTGAGFKDELRQLLASDVAKGA